MTARPTKITDELYDYVVAHGATPDPIAQDLIDETQTTLGEDAIMQVAPDTAAFLTMLTKIVGVRVAVEVGTFTGYSSMSIARGLADGGKLICCDVSREFTDIARRYWERAGLADRIELRLAPALQTLRAMPTEPHIDLAFVDALKTEYEQYWAELVPRMRQGGLIVVDNTLFHGGVVDPQSDFHKAIVAFNEVVISDDRVDTVMLPFADGITLGRRR